ncbi:MAG TPA: phage major capsid protein, partial [Chloroflexota bacterium]
YAGEMIKAVLNKSAAMRGFRHKQMSAKQQRIAVLSAFPTAAFVNPTDVGQKSTTNLTWQNKFLEAEPIACIIPIPEDVMDDADLDWEEIKPYAAEAIAIALDNAVFFGVGKPASWPTAIIPAAIAAGNVVVAGTSTVDLADDINNVMAAVEADGFDINGFFGRQQLKAKLRGLRTADKALLFQPEGPANVGVSNANEPSGEDGRLFSEPIYFSKAGFAGFATGAANYSLVAGDFNQGVLGIRKDITYKVLTEATLYDTDGTTVLYKLAQQDMVALRVVTRVGFQVPNPINRMQPTEGSRYPFGVLQQKASTGGEG